MPVLPTCIVSVAPPELLMGERTDEAVAEAEAEAVAVAVAAPAVPFSLSNADNKAGVPEGGRLYCCCCGVAATAQSLSYVTDASPLSVLALALSPTISQSLSLPPLPPICCSKFALLLLLLSPPDKRLRELSCRC